jgi:hypothetical protein
MSIVFWNNSLIISRFQTNSFCSYYIYAVFSIEVAANTNYANFGLTRPGFEHTTYHIGERVDYQLSHRGGILSYTLCNYRYRIPFFNNTF